MKIKNKNITFTVNGKSYIKTTDGDGIASLPINLATGKYTVSYSFKGDSKVDAKTASSAITVKDRTKTKITWKSGTSFYQGAQTYKVLLQDSSNKEPSYLGILIFGIKYSKAVPDQDINPFLLFKIVHKLIFISSISDKNSLLTFSFSNKSGFVLKK